MFKQVLAYVLVLTTLAANCTQLFVYAGFEINQKYIAAELCVNRNRPELHCNGKCYLMRKLKQAEQKEKAHESENQRPVLQPGLIVEKLALAAPSFFVTKSLVVEENFNLPERSSTIFQPPKV
jgi:hypothetical protein